MASVSGRAQAARATAACGRRTQHPRAGAAWRCARDRSGVSRYGFDRSWRAAFTAFRCARQSRASSRTVNGIRRRRSIAPGSSLRPRPPARHRLELLCRGWFGASPSSLASEPWSWSVIPSWRLARPHALSPVPPTPLATSPALFTATRAPAGFGRRSHDSTLARLLAGSPRSRRLRAKSCHSGHGAIHHRAGSRATRSWFRGKRIWLGPRWSPDHRRADLDLASYRPPSVVAGPGCAARDHRPLGGERISSRWMSGSPAL